MGIIHGSGKYHNYCRNYSYINGIYSGICGYRHAGILHQNKRRENWRGYPHRPHPNHIRQ